MLHFGRTGRAAVLDEILRKLEENDIQRIKVAGFDVDGVLRGKYISPAKFSSAAADGFGFCDVIFGWDCADALYDQSRVTGWHTGYPDTLARIDLGSFRLVPWEKRTALFLVDFMKDAQTPLSVSPRQVLQRVIERAGAMGFVPKASCEYEFFFFKETPQSLHQKGFNNLETLTPGMFGYSVLRASAQTDLIDEIVCQMKAYDCEVEGIHTETGPGVFEAALHYDELLRAADRAALFKTGIKEIASRHGLTACFMAKWNKDLPGCSGHLHQSLWDRKTRAPAFADGPRGRSGLSKTLESYIAGQCALMRETTALIAPTINSYKRMVPGTWAPTHVAWGVENRTTALRVITGPSAKATRVEYRLAAADINPYIALAASFGAGLWGIEKALEPPPPVSGNAYTQTADDATPLPRSLDEAAGLLDRSEAAREILGAEFIDHYVMTRRWEVAQFQRAVTGWELSRYMEII
ncbi:MAG: glutamine synthetase [Candidatus Wallbacteria bacterium]|nr:glutamine synthetase [Candidatus Wallbacteria bacterium]